MEVYILLLTCVAVISVSGQFLEVEYRPDGAPLPVRRRLSNARYEIQPSVSQEIEQQSIETARTSNQGRRHIENQYRDNLQNGPTHRNDFEPQHSADGRPNNNREQGSNYDNQFNAQRQQNQEFVSNIPPPYNNELKTNLDQTFFKPNTPSYPSSDSVRTNDPSRNHGEGIVKTSSQDPYVRSNVNPTNRPIARSYESSSNSDNVINNKESYNRKTIDGNNYDNIQNTDFTRANEKSIRVDSNRNGDNRPSTEYRRINDNRYFDNSLQSTETPGRITFDDRHVTGGTKYTLDNELISEAHERRPGNEISTKTTTEILPTVDDRAAFSGGKCPSGQVRFNNMCVYKD